MSFVVVSDRAGRSSILDGPPVPAVRCSVEGKPVFHRDSPFEAASNDRYRYESARNREPYAVPMHRVQQRAYLRSMQRIRYADDLGTFASCVSSVITRLLPVGSRGRAESRGDFPRRSKRGSRIREQIETTERVRLHEAVHFPRIKPSFRPSGLAELCSYVCKRSAPSIRLRTRIHSFARGIIPLGHRPVTSRN